MNVRQNVTLRWTYEISAGETYTILWGTSNEGTSIRDILFKKESAQATAEPVRTMPAKYSGRVKIIQQASLFIQRVDLSDEGFYICQINGAFVTLRKKINLTVIGECEIVIFCTFAGVQRKAASAVRNNIKYYVMSKVESVTALFVY